MSKVIATLDRAQREGHFHALLESPTGTGKSLSLLCSALAWQKKNHHSKPQAFGGGGFVPEFQTSGNTMPTLSETNNAKQKKKIGPVIYYCTRTHSQISQVIGEFRKTNYHAPMAVLGSRKRYCTNAKVRDQDNMDEKCKLLLKELKTKEAGCREFMNAPKIRAHPSLKKGGTHEVHDIEDLLKVGEMVEGCPYFASQDMAEVADIVFCPYSYIINPQIRKAMGIKIKGNIIILDEAHNIEDVARDAASIDVEEDILYQLLRELEDLSQSNRVSQADQVEIYRPLHEMMEGILGWIRRRKISLGKHSFQHDASWWVGDKAVKELQEANISKQCFPSLQDCATKAIEIATEADPEVDHLSGMPCTVLEGLFSSLTYFFSEDGTHICDYLLALQCPIKRGAGLADDDWPCTFSLWCLNPALVFKNIADSALSVILTSGTLSPMNSFQSELGVQFGTSLEAPHVINVDSQLWAGVIHSGPGNYPLNASYKTSEGYDFQDALGTSLEEICKVVPGGCLVFFPSYKLMDKLCSRWSQTGQWSRLNAQKPVFVEPRGGQEDFEQLLKDYYDTIRHGNKPTNGRRRAKKWDANCTNATKSKGNSVKGATFLAVCRGKVSEGIDFSDENARAVIIVGIPFPNVTDIQVAEKKKYNDTHKSSKHLLSGNDWYCQQAFRALNQAAGRCIRHRLDYGAIIFLDERFRQERNLTYISKWIRKSIREYDDFGQSLDGLKSFFRGIKVENNASSMPPIDVSAIDVEEPRNWLTEMKNHKVTKSNRRGPKSVSDEVAAPEKRPQTESKCREKRAANKSDIKTWTAFTDVEADLETPDRCSFPPLSPNDFELSVVKETCPNTLESPSDDYEFSTCASECLNNAFVTPRKEQISQNRSPSVNSHAHNKRRKSSASVMEQQFGSPNLKTLTEVMKFGVPRRSSEYRSEISSSSSSSITCGDVMKKDLRISCLLCRSSLGLEENNYIISSSSLMSLTKVHLTSLWKGGKLPAAAEGPTSIPVVVTGITSVDRRMWETSPEGSSTGQQGIWIKEDGCVYNTIFCTGCGDQDNCLGFHVVATDSSNVQFLNKVLLYSNRLEMQHIDSLTNKELSPFCATSGTNETSELYPFEKFAYVPPQETNSSSSSGWRRSTNWRMRLPKKVQSSNAKYSMQKKNRRFNLWSKLTKSDLYKEQTRC